MPDRQRLIDTANRRAARIVRELCEELREARLAAGLRQIDVGAAVGASGAKISRIERARLSSVAIPTLVRIGAVVGLDVSVRCFPAAESGLRDVAHQRLIGRLRARVSPAFAWRLEVPIRPGDQRAFDVLLTVKDQAVAVEAETRLRDVQALIRRIAAKQADAGVDRLVLAVAATHANRRAVRDARPMLEMAFPVSSRRTLAALATGVAPAGNGLVMV